MSNHAHEVPIETIEQARAYFMEMECSPFHMGREYPERYAEYMQLNIPQQTETQWRKERFQEIYTELTETADNDSLRRSHDRLYDLYKMLKSDEELMKMLDATKHIRNRVPENDRVMIAETINGRETRQARGGLIYIAYDSGNVSAAREFAELSLYFSSYKDDNKWKFWDKKKERYQRSTRLCKDIMQELGLI